MQQMFHVHLFLKHLPALYLSMASPLEHLGTPEDIVKVLSFMVGEDSNWINAQVVRVNGDRLSFW